MELSKKNFSTLVSQFSFQKGFTLIELLIVIAIIGIMAAGVLVAIDPIEKIRQGNDSKVQNDISGIGRAAEAYAVTHNSFYPATLNDLLSSGELKRIPLPPTAEYGSEYKVANTPSGCVAGTTCTGIAITGPLRAKRYTAAATPFWRYESSTGQSCAVLVIENTCSQPAATPTSPPPTPTNTPTP